MKKHTSSFDKQSREQLWCTKYHSQWGNTVRPDRIRHRCDTTIRKFQKTEPSKDIGLLSSEDLKNTETRVIKTLTWTFNTNR